MGDNIKANDPQRLIFYESAIFDIFGGGFASGLGYPEQEVYSYHIYCGVNDKEGDPASRLLCDMLDPVFFRAKERNIKTMKIGGFLTEFGAVTNSTKGSKELDKILNLADSYQRSWTHW